jgi:beta-glucosidase
MTASNSPDFLIEQLTAAEHVSMLAGIDFWHTAPVERLGIPSLRVSDGPAGARGTRFDGPASLNVPCSTALAATWDPDLVELIGQVLGRETRAKGAGVLLAPTVNLHRTPIGGRNFECMSEDPYLTARTAVAYVRGLQSEGVASCIKHFVGNDTEFERMSIDSQIDERTLRELYLVPFEAAVTEAGVLAVMTGYNRINGPFAADSQPLLRGVLRGEWGFDGLVMSDWFGLHSTVEGIAAGLDLEMPGPTRFRGDALLEALERGDVTADHVREAARNVLTLMDRVGALRGDGPGPELTRDDPDDRALIRAAAASGMVLLRNEPGPNESAVLPLTTDTLSRVAVIGPNAAIGQIMGGGSAHVTPTAVIHPLTAITERLEAHGVEVSHAVGCIINRRLPALDLRRCGPVTIDYFADPADLDRPDAEPARSTTTGTAHMMWVADPLDRPGTAFEFGARLRTTFTPDATGEWRLGVEAVAPARLLVDGDVVLDNTDVPVGGSFFGTGRAELTAAVALEAGRSYQLDVEVRHHHTGMGMGGMNIGSQAPLDGDPMADAVDVAAAADVAIVIVGTNDDWESEGWDRSVLELPGQQDDLIRNVALVNARTIVVVNAGSPVAMPWLDDVAAVLVTWFPGQEMGAALVDVLFGDVEPQGRLPVTFPHRLEDTPAFEHHPGRNGAAPYLERRLMGYRWYDTVGREPLFAFGHGLGYADVSIEAARITDPFTVDVELANASDRDGVAVVQVYVHRALHDGAGDEPAQRLVGFAKVDVASNGSATATIALDPRAYMTWDVDSHAWVDITGEFELRVGTSSRRIAARLEQHR